MHAMLIMRHSLTFRAIRLKQYLPNSALEKMSKPLAGRVCLVTGATRGIGKGIALQLGANGAKVYITGRTLDTPNGSIVGGSLRDTAEEIQARGGKCVPVQCDHGKDVEVERLFEQIKRRNDGQLDILVNNAFSAVNAIFGNTGKTFWEVPTSLWDDVNNVGLRNHYLCSVYAARMMVPRKRGLIVNISSAGGLRYFFNVPYGVGKEACDRMVADCAFELRKSNVAFVSLWPAVVSTENLTAILQKKIKDESTSTSMIGPVEMDPKKAMGVLGSAESTEFPGKCVVELAMDPDIMSKSGRILMTYDLGREYGIADEDGHTPRDIRQLKCVLQRAGYQTVSWLVPRFLRIPKWMVHFYGYKF